MSSPIQQQGSALLIALALMVFMTTLGTIVLQTAHALQLLAIERAEERTTTVLLESLIVATCQEQGAAWLKQDSKIKGAQPHEIYTTSINGVVCKVSVTVEKGAMVVSASCTDKRGDKHVLTATLGTIEDKNMVIRAWKRS